MSILALSCFVLPAAVALLVPGGGSNVTAPSGFKAFSKKDVALVAGKLGDNNSRRAVHISLLAAGSCVLLACV